MATQAAYLDIKEQLIKQIQEGKYAINEALPSERVLSIEFNVSRMTARKAVDQLEKEGYVERIARKGTFVKSRKLVRNSEIRGFGDALREYGFKNIEAITLGNEVIEADDLLAGKLKIKIGDPVFVLTRVRCADGTPYALEISHIPLGRFPGLNKIDFTHHSLFGILKEDYKTTVTYADRLISVTYCDTYLAKHMKLKEKDPIFILNSLNYDTNKNPMEYLVSYNPIDKTTFYYELDYNADIDYTFNRQESEE